MARHGASKPTTTKIFARGKDSRRLEGAKCDVTCTDEGTTDSVPLTVTIALDHGKRQ